ncbi:MAG: hypothetical protein ACQETI_13100 [Halobacteriota archaeon]
MRLTRRGKVVAVLVAVGFAMAVTFGARSLNAVVFPGVIGLLAAVVQQWWCSPPEVSHEAPRDGFPDETGTVVLSVETDSPFVATVTDELSAGLSGESTVQTTVGAEPITYEITYEHRGKQRVGPTRVVAQDVLGLTERRFDCRGHSEILVYPRVYGLTRGAREELRALYDAGRATTATSSTASASTPTGTRSATFTGRRAPSATTSSSKSSPQIPTRRRFR